ncbi:hypothetical protein PHISCL_03146 [Aspergillus sclerotialis]|uniref:Aminotransferase class I/classII large domain-containing protein n=1 Tax=Aspergillus sclerotialis TaxID=2070753 RepID=A0A3A2ZMN7_9EURO|nr:hypothetical protein PHISCL_03146 [Aspergillus sclerotialis]
MGSLVGVAAQPPQVLSSRGQAAVDYGSKKITWDIISNLWHPETNPNGYVSVGIAENVMLHDSLLDYLHANIKLPSKFLTYNEGSMGSTPLRESVSHFLNRHLVPVRPIEPGHIFMTNGCSSAIEQLSSAFTEPGEGILLGRPYYGTFIADLSLRPQAVVVPVDFGDVDPLGPYAVAQYEKAAKAFEERSGKRVRAVMLCHPHNPLGRCYPPSVIIEIMKFCQSRQLHLISDEIYALSVWENKVDTDPKSAPVLFKSVLSIDTSGIIDSSLVHVLWGMSKDFGANGLRVGAIISQSNAPLHTSLIATSLYSFVSGLSDQITATVLRDDEFTDKYIRLNQDNLSNCHNFVARQLQKHNIEYERGCNAGFFLWVNLGKKYLENNTWANLKVEGHQLTDLIMQKLLGKKVFLANGTVFGCEKPGWFRIVFAHPIPYLEEAMRRIMSALLAQE